MTTAPEFVHLRTHSHYSLLSATCRIPQLVAKAVEDGQPALALTDSGNLFGAIEFYKKCGKDVKPLLGMEAYCAANSMRENTSAENPNYQLVLLATSDQGWDNLKQISSISYRDGFYYRPRVDLELLSQHAEGIVALSSGMYGEIGQHLTAGRNADAMQAAGRLQEVFGADSFFLELQEIGVEPQRQCNEGMLALRDRLELGVVATNDVHYIAPEDWVAQDIATCIRGGKAVTDPKRFRMASRDLFFKTREQMAAAFGHVPDALANTVAIAERSTVDIEFNNYHLPIFDTGSDETADQAFERICYEGAVERYGEVTDPVRERLEYELGVIRKLGFVSYFLITWDFIREARVRGIPVGPGRGSAAGSMVAYCMRITDLDPLKYNLIFERFLNAARISMPDIDVDFCGERRDEVIDYVREKYGHANVSQIITFGTMASRGVLRDVGRVLEVPLGEIDKLAKKVPQGPGASLVKALESDPELGEIRDSTPENKRLFELGLKLEGLARHSSVHAAGVVVADRPLTDYIPMARNGGDITTQWQMTELEEVGLLKVDFLGLKTLTILTEAVRLIKQVHDVAVDLDHLPLDDQPTFDLMTRGDTLGVFQLESSGMRELLGRLKPDTFEDVIAVLALYRPGPLGSGMVDMFTRRKHGEEPVEYPHETLAEILEETYGVIVYQEQVMRIANVLGGFSMNQADSLRKAMGKKKPEVMLKFKEEFIEGAGAQNHDKKVAKEIFETMEYFAGYGFNKSHSAAYALLTYQTAWLKTHYPLEFVAANLTVESSNSEKVKEYIDECRRRERVVLGPDANKSFRFFNVETDGDQPAIRFGLGAIKGMGSRVADAIAEDARENGPYQSIEDLCERIDAQLLNKTALEALAKTGALESLGMARREAFEAVDRALRASASAREDKRRGQGLLFGAPPPAAETASADDDGVEESLEWSEADRLAKEKEALGFYLSGHPFEKRGKFYARLAGNTSATLADVPSGESVRISGMVSSVRILTIKQGRNAGLKMARFLLEDLDGMIPITCFARTYAEVKDDIVEDSIVFIEGRIEREGEETAMLLDSLKPAQSIVNAEVSALVLRLEQADAARQQAIDRIKRLASAHKGDQRLMLEITDGEDTWRIRTSPRFSVRLSDELLDGFADLLGAGSLAFTRT